MDRGRSGYLSAIEASRQVGVRRELARYLKAVSGRSFRDAEFGGYFGNRCRNSALGSPSSGNSTRRQQPLERVGPRHRPQLSTSHVEDERVFVAGPDRGLSRPSWNFAAAVL